MDSTVKSTPEHANVAAKNPGFIKRGLNRWFSFSTRGVRITIEIIVLVLTLALVGVWFYAPYFVRDYINKSFAGLPDYTGRVEWVRIHPITASIDVYDFHVDKKGVPVHFFYSPRWNVGLQWGEIIHGVLRASVTIFNPQVNLVAAPSTGQSQEGISGVWIDAIRALIPFRINRLIIHNGDAHFLDFHADPQVDLECNKIEFSAYNMSNAQKLKTPLPASIQITAAPLLTGYFQMNLQVNFDEKFATFTQDFQMEHVPAVGANSALQKFLKVRVKSGTIGLYSELTGDKGVYHGYVKPFFDHLEFEPKESDKGTPGAIWSAALNGVKSLLENDQKVIATQTPISGRVDDPKINTWAAFTGVLWNAYIQALRPGFDTALSPTPPTDTVTTPKSDATAQEAQAVNQGASPAQKPTVDQVKAKAHQKENN